MNEPTSAIREETPNAVHASWMAALGPPVALSIPVALLLAYIGPFGTGAAPIAPRALYWIFVMASMSALGVAASRVGDQLRARRVHTLIASLMVLVLLSTAGLPLVWLTTAAFFGFPLRLEQIAFYGPPVVVISVLMTALNMLRARGGVSAAATTPVLSSAEVSTRETPQARFLQRLPVQFRSAALVALEAEDHYLRVHTDGGSTLILMRLADAIAELEGVEGEQTHRSWWVARAGIAAVRRHDGRAELTLTNGIEAPVSRTHARRLKTLGWI